MSNDVLQLANIPYKYIMNEIKKCEPKIKSLNVVEFTSISNLKEIFPDLKSMLVKMEFFLLGHHTVSDNNTIYVIIGDVVMIYQKDQSHLYIAREQFKLTECVFNSFNEAFKDIHIKNLKLSNIEDDKYVFDYMFVYLKIDNLDMTEIRFENIVSAEEMFRFAKIKNLKLPKDARNFIEENDKNNMFVQSDISNIQYAK